MEIVYDGIRWVKQKSGYYESARSRKDRPYKHWLHQYIYEKEKGKIKKGYHVHHIDGDKDNNKIENLELITPSEHSKRHWEEMSREDYEKWYKKQKKHLDKIRPGYIWPKDPVKKEEFRLKLKKAMQEMKEKIFICDQCGKEYSRKPIGGGRFCSNACKSAWRRAEGVDNVERLCQACGKKFYVNKYKDTQTCSRLCANVIRGRTIRNTSK